jgi:hypothetical protein
MDERSTLADNARFNDAPRPSMPHTNPAPGAPCWFELSSTDPATSLKFYSTLLGWTGVPEETPNGPYTFLRNSNGTVGALAGLPPGVPGPSRWAAYFLTTDIDASLARVVDLGGTVLMGPFDAGSHGRGAYVADPSGAAFALWQSFAPDGGDFTMFESNAFGWVELATRDAPGARHFYGELLGWSLTESKVPIPGDIVYTEYSINGTRCGGILPMTKEWGDMPSHWSLYVVVDHCDQVLARAVELGGSVCVPAFDAPGVGRIGMIADPTGAMTYVIALGNASQ